MDFRRPLFHLERLSPSLAKKIWALAPVLKSPFILGLGLQIHHFSDSDIEVGVPANRQNLDDYGEIHVSVLMAAAELSSRMLWSRHTRPGAERMDLVSMRCEFHKSTVEAAIVRASLNEIEREKILRKMHAGETIVNDVIVQVLDSKKQSLAQMVCQWKFRQVGPLALKGGI